MKTTLLFRILLVTLLVWPGSRLLAQDEQDLIATLQSGAPATQKWAACQKLRVIGTAKSVPALAALLTQDGLSQAARYVLEALPGPEADAALRDALGKTSGLLKAGVVDSLGWRGEPKSVPFLTPLLADPDPNVASAAASSLSRIGGPAVIEAFSSMRDKVAPAAQPTLLEGLLRCADRLASANDNAAALRIYHDLFDPKYALSIRTAAWRGLAVTDSAHRTELIVNALQGTDRPVQKVALKLMRELSDRRLLQACIAKWNSVSLDSQLALLDAEVKFGPEAVSLAHIASQSPDLRLRVAGWQAMGELNDASAITALANAATKRDPSEQEAARESLRRLRGPGATQALLSQVDRATAPEKAELFRALGERGDKAASSVLLKNAASDEKVVRQASLEGLGRLAPPEAAGSLLEMAAKSKSDDDRSALLSALYAVCDASPDKEQISRSVVEKIDRFPVAERRPLLPLLAELGTADALVAAQAVSRDSDVETAKEGVRVLSQWPNAAPASSLLELARDSHDPTLRTLALRGSIQVVAQEPDSTRRMTVLREAMAQTSRVEEKRQILGQLGQVPSPEALEMALQELGDSGLTDEAGLASVSIAEKLAPTHPDLADDAAGKLLARIHEGDLARRAYALRRKPSVNAPFIRDWLVCGPFLKAGVVGATSLFDVAFGPEKPGANLDWKNAPPSDHVNLGALFPGQDNCVAYLRTRIVAPQDCRALLLLGSDDGVKAWLNEQVVHSNNVDRGEVTDQDTAPIHLKKGANDLMLKITQGGGGWSACARIVDPDFKPLAGLQVECPKGRD